MDFSKNKTMELPKPEVDWNFIAGCITGLIAWFYFIHWYFKSKSQEKKEWIENIAKTAVQVAMSESFKDVNKKIDTLFTLREADRVHIDNKFDIMITEMRKP